MDFAGEYTIPYSPKYAPTHLEVKGAYYEDGWYSDGTYLIKSEKPKTKTPYQPMPMPWAGVASFLKTQNSDLYPAILGAVQYSNPTGRKDDNTFYLDVYCHGMPYDALNKSEAMFDPRIIDVILKKYPDAQPFMRTDGVLFFKMEEEIVAIAARLSDGQISDKVKSMRNEK